MYTPARQTENQPTKATQMNGSFFGTAGSAPFFQSKPTVNTPGDAYEQEADRIADSVMRMSEGDVPVVQRMPITPVSGLQRKCADCEKEEQEQVQRKETTGGDPSGKSAPSIVSDVISSGGGQPMDGGTRQFMENRFGQDFGQVRIHTDSRAAESASAIQARAYTSGRDVVFGKGEYQPDNESGKRLLAHELVHVGQQGFNQPFENIILRKEHGDISQLPMDVIASCDAVASPTPGIEQEQRIRGVQYPIESSSISNRMLRVLNQFVVDWHAQGTNSLVEIFGYASTDGAEGYNWRLSCHRANAVKNILLRPPNSDRGIPEDRIITNAQGETDKFDRRRLPANRIATIVSTVPLNQTPPPFNPLPSQENCRELIGNCDYYLCRERKHPCGERGYYRAYGHRNCNRFTQETRPRMTEAGMEWLDCVRGCLQEYIERELPEDADCETVFRGAMQSHAQCYADCGICRLPPGDLGRITDTVDPEDMYLAQVLETMARCATFPPPPNTRGFQLECVMRLGGCPQTRSGGFPTAEEIAGYNEQCRDQTNYTGDDVSPGDEECRRYFGR